MKNSLKDCTSRYVFRLAHSRSLSCHASDPSESEGKQESSIAARIAAAKRYKEFKSTSSEVSTQQSLPILKPSPPQSTNLPLTAAPNSLEISHIESISKLQSQSAQQASSQQEPLLNNAPTVSLPSFSALETPSTNPSAMSASSTYWIAPSDSYQPPSTDQQVPQPLAPPQDAVPFLERVPDASLPSTQLAAMIFNATQAPGRGSAVQAEPSLASVLKADSVIDTNLRAEEFTLQKEERMKQMGAQIITVDLSYKPGGALAGT
jgi:hypothetical protein